jgi:hypothetical protein
MELSYFPLHFYLLVNKYVIIMWRIRAGYVMGLFHNIWLGLSFVTISRTPLKKFRCRGAAFDGHSGTIPITLSIRRWNPRKLGFTDMSSCIARDKFSQRRTDSSNVNRTKAGCELSRYWCILKTRQFDVSHLCVLANISRRSKSVATETTWFKIF